jgi:hypothetical protein
MNYKLHAIPFIEFSMDDVQEQWIILNLSIYMDKKEPLEVVFQWLELARILNYANVVVQRHMNKGGGAF